VFANFSATTLNIITLTITTIDVYTKLSNKNLYYDTQQNDTQHFATEQQSA